MKTKSEDIERTLDLADAFLERLQRRPLPPEWVEADLTVPQLRVLFALYFDGPLSCGSLAETIGLSLPTLTGILERLSRRGYLDRRRSGDDRRRVISTLSPRGEHLVSRLWASAREDVAQVLEMLTPADLVSVQQTFEVLIEALEQHAPASQRALTAR